MGTLSLSSFSQTFTLFIKTQFIFICVFFFFSETKQYLPQTHKLISPPLRTTSPSPLRFANASIEMSQTQESAICGAESNVMGLLLRERIVFLGSSIDGFVADAIMSQLLLLDAKDLKKDIKLFINSPGGSLRDKHFRFIYQRMISVASCSSCELWEFPQYVEFIEINEQNQ